MQAGKTIQPPMFERHQQKELKVVFPMYALRLNNELRITKREISGLEHHFLN
jgi:hypothetical protein